MAKLTTTIPSPLSAFLGRPKLKAPPVDRKTNRVMTGKGLQELMRKKV